MTDSLPLLLTSKMAAAVAGVSVSTFNEWVRKGLVPEHVIATNEFGGWRRYYRVQLEHWLAGDHIEAAS